MSLITFVLYNIASMTLITIFFITFSIVNIVIAIICVILGFIDSRISFRETVNDRCLHNFMGFITLENGKIFDIDGYAKNPDDIDELIESVARDVLQLIKEFEQRHRKKPLKLINSKKKVEVEKNG